MSWHNDYDTCHLSGESLTVANKVRDYLHETLLPPQLIIDEYPDDEHGLNNCASGCRLFVDKFSFITGGGDRDYTTHEVDAVLHLVVDGGVLYDMYSPNGDGEYLFGGGSRYKLEQFITDLGYLPEWTTSYCLSIHRGDC